jgi:hypothetical protein
MALAGTLRTGRLDGLLRDKTRPSRTPPLGPLTQNKPPDEASHWTAAAMAQASSISASSVQRIWRGHGLQPHRVRTFKLSNDPAFASKLRDVVGLAPQTDLRLWAVEVPLLERDRT